MNIFQVGDKEWEKYRVAFVIQGKAHYIDDDEKTIITKVCFPLYLENMFLKNCVSGFPRVFNAW